MIELVDLRYRPEVNTIEALAESDPSEHAPLAEPTWTTPPEESGLGVGCKLKIESLSFIGGAARIPVSVDLRPNCCITGSLYRRTRSLS